VGRDQVPKNRERLLKAEAAHRFFEAAVSQARQRRLLMDEHFTVDGTMIEAWVSEKSYGRKPGPPPSAGSGWKGEVLLRDTHDYSTPSETSIAQPTPPIRPTPSPPTSRRSTSASATGKAESSRLNAPPFLVLGSSPLRSIVLKRPRTVAELAAIDGITPEAAHNLAPPSFKFVMPDRKSSATLASFRSREAEHERK
jgi:hypothetical protein